MDAVPVLGYALLGSYLYREVGGKGVRSFHILYLGDALIQPWFLVGADDRANTWDATMSHGSHAH